MLSRGRPALQESGFRGGMSAYMRTSEITLVATSLGLHGRGKRGIAAAGIFSVWGGLPRRSAT